MSWRVYTAKTVHLIVDRFVLIKKISTKKFSLEILLYKYVSFYY